MSEPTTPRKKRGAQANNANAFKHGLYSRRLQTLSPAALSDLKIGSVEEEIHLVRIMIARHLEMRASNPASTAEESLTDLRVVSFAVSRLASLMRLAKNLPAGSPDSEDWMNDLLEGSLKDNDPDSDFSSFPSDPNGFIQ